MELNLDIKNYFLLNVLSCDYALSVYVQGEESLEMVSSTNNPLGVLNFKSKKIEKKKEVMLPIELYGSIIGALQVKVPFSHNLDKKETFTLDELTKSLAPLIRNATDPRELTYNVEVYKWLLGAKKILGSTADWLGIYYKSEYLVGEKNEDLLLGPYIGESTEHVKIPITEGLCGLALRENHVVNIPDVSVDDRHIACSLKTKSELIVPIRNSFGDSIAELDIDSNKVAAFTSKIEEEIVEYCLTFPLK